MEPAQSQSPILTHPTTPAKVQRRQQQLMPEQQRATDPGSKTTASTDFREQGTTKPGQIFAKVQPGRGDRARR